jgi:hypothetical protein
VVWFQITPDAMRLIQSGKAGSRISSRCADRSDEGACIEDRRRGFLVRAWVAKR